MTVLSEATLKHYIGAGQIVVGGRESDIRGQSYSCHAAKIFLVGLAILKVIRQPWWIGQIPRGLTFIESSRANSFGSESRETVSLPSDVCAFWWQTNSLSRKGLMLINMSMVDPGYEGSLACLFVNFGRQPVDIDPGITVARLVFHRLDGGNVPFGKGAPREEYDRQLRDVALNGPTSFLSFQEFSAAFQTERDRVFESFKLDAEAHGRELQARLDKSSR